MNKILISAPASGAGKTIVTLAIEAALCARGLRVQPFKCGPDYLDSGHHSFICARPCRNLDAIMLSPEQNCESLRCASTDADMIIAEGMMGLFDGVDGGSDRGSSAELARMLGFPVVLVVDASHCSRSIAAMIHGFVSFDPQTHVVGVILNRVAGEAHYKMLSQAIATSIATPLLGWLPRDANLSLPERHLGVSQAEERAWSAQDQSRMAELAEKYIDMDQLMAVAGEEPFAPISVPMAMPVARIAVAKDLAFGFYYQDNFDLLRQAGAELVEFSPLQDECAPPDCDAMYLGGGYPELYAESLHKNETMRNSIREFCRSGRPVYAECGGMMFLAEQMIVDGHSYEMCGALPLRVEMTTKLVKFGYVRVRYERDCLLGRKDDEAIGHSFHYSKTEAVAPIEQIYDLKYIRSGREEREGFAVGNVQASYVHLHFRSNPNMAKRFVQLAEEFKKHRR